MLLALVVELLAKCVISNDGHLQVEGFTDSLPVAFKLWIRSARVRSLYVTDTLEVKNMMSDRR